MTNNHPDSSLVVEHSTEPQGIAEKDGFLVHVGLGEAGALGSWLSMLQRCLIPTHQSFKHYGGRGIRVCERWKDFNNFLADLGPRPYAFSLERVNVNGNYEPANCRWMLLRNQPRNTRRTVRVAEEMIAMDLARKLKVQPSTIHHRVKNGETGQELFRAKGAKGIKLWRSDVEEIRVELKHGTSQTALAKRYGVSRQMISSINTGKAWGCL